MYSNDGKMLVRETEKIIWMETDRGLYWFELAASQGDAEPSSDATGISTEQNKNASRVAIAIGNTDWLANSVLYECSKEMKDVRR